METTSHTPRTDAEHIRILNDDQIDLSREIDAMTDFARQLETELNEARAELAEAVTRMEAVTDGAIVQAYWSDGSWISNVRARLISAAKGEQQ